MIEVQVGKIGRARIENGLWTSAIASLRSILQDETSTLFIHGGVPDRDEFIVQEMLKRLPSVSIVSATDAPEDTEATDQASDERGTD